MAPIFKIATFLSLTLYVAAQGTQFITGTCASDAECASACCGFKTGKCAAPFVANERGEGCGFGTAAPNNDALNGNKTPAAGQANGSAPAAEAASPAPAASAAPASDAPQAAPGSQFITGPCTKDADCSSKCCGFKSGKCAGPVVAQERDGGCGFGDAAPNDDAAKALAGRGLGRRGPSYM
jgi:hypothetical protein